MRDLMAPPARVREATRSRRWRAEGAAMLTIALPIVGANLLAMSMGMTVRKRLVWLATFFSCSCAATSITRVAALVGAFVSSHPSR